MESFKAPFGQVNLPQDPIPLRTVRITVPLAVTYSFDKMTDINKKVLGKLGCPECHSGFVLIHDFERDFKFNEKLEQIQVGQNG